MSEAPRRRLLVTGATGFLGGAVAREALRGGWHVMALRRPGTPIRSSLGGVTWRSLDEIADVRTTFDAVVHAAAQRHRHGVPPADYAPINRSLTESVLRAVRGRCVRFVAVSSIAVYGWPKELPIDERRPYAPTGAYGASKVETERMVRESKVPFTIVQPSITYGPGDTNGMIDKMARMIAGNAFVAPGLGANRVQLVYVDDFARLTLAAATSERTLGQTFICTHADPIRMRDLIGLLRRATRSLVPTVGPPKALLELGARLMEFGDRRGFFDGEPPLTREKLATVSVDRAYVIDRMRHLLGDEPRVSYADGVRCTTEALGLWRGGS